MNNEGMQNFDVNGGNFHASSSQAPSEKMTGEQANSIEKTAQISSLPENLQVATPEASTEQLSSFEQRSPLQQMPSSPETKEQPNVELTAGASLSIPAPDKASDRGKIEKEWVHHTAKTIDTYQDDPKKLEEAFEALQDDYLKKRFNRAIGDRNI